MGTTSQSSNIDNSPVSDDKNDLSLSKKSNSEEATIMASMFSLGMMNAKMPPKIRGSFKRKRANTDGLPDKL